ncbi:protein-S-isoprenylcysteine O-methyltransferase Ste14 [Alkalibacillus flavidus]|uniref:Protein-S-isoprenylcysteine O-methyltransferase Ste14 n=1 Tax=Alkalibacillus flavidus TaxID=546021 RepID=A0ABV2KWB9_9BACI
MVDLIFIVLSVIWVLEFAVFRNRQMTDETDRHSFTWVLFAVICVITVSLMSREFEYWLMDESLVSWVGLLLLSLGITLRYWGIQALGKQFTRHVYVDENDTLVSHGPFRYLRHPLYTGLTCIVIGFSLINLSILGLIIVVTIFIPAIIHRMQLEENMLKASFGPTYEQWMQQRARLIPFIY